MSKSQRHIFTVIAVAKTSKTHVNMSMPYFFQKKSTTVNLFLSFFLLLLLNVQTLTSCVQTDSFHSEKKIQVIIDLKIENLLELKQFLQWTDVTK